MNIKKQTIFKLLFFSSISNLNFCMNFATHGFIKAAEEKYNEQQQLLIENTKKLPDFKNYLLLDSILYSLNKAKLNLNIFNAIILTAIDFLNKKEEKYVFNHYVKNFNTYLFVFFKHFIEKDKTKNYKYLKIIFTNKKKLLNNFLSFIEGKNYNKGKLNFKELVNIRQKIQEIFKNNQSDRDYFNTIYFGITYIINNNLINKNSFENLIKNEYENHRFVNISARSIFEAFHFLNDNFANNISCNGNASLLKQNLEFKLINI